MAGAAEDGGDRLLGADVDGEGRLARHLGAQLGQVSVLGARLDEAARYRRAVEAHRVAVLAERAIELDVLEVAHVVVVEVREYVAADARVIHHARVEVVDANLRVEFHLAVEVVHLSLSLVVFAPRRRRMRMKTATAHETTATATVTCKCLCRA